MSRIPFNKTLYLKTLAAVTVALALFFIAGIILLSTVAKFRINTQAAVTPEI